MTTGTQRRWFGFESLQNIHHPSAMGFIRPALLEIGQEPRGTLYRQRFLCLWTCVVRLSLQLVGKMEVRRGEIGCLLSKTSVLPLGQIARRRR